MVYKLTLKDTLRVLISLPEMACVVPLERQLTQGGAWQQRGAAKAARPMSAQQGAPIQNFFDV